MSFNLKLFTYCLFKKNSLLASRNMSKTVKIVEVGPRDGLQNEKKILSLDERNVLINNLMEAGLYEIEIGSFVSKKWVPQMADTDSLYKLIKPNNKLKYICLVPNKKGLQKAIECGCTSIAVFTSASQAFSQKNTNSSIEESIKNIENIMILAAKSNISVRGYISCVVHCPYEKFIKPVVVSDLAKKLLNLGIREISLGDTTGAATPRQIEMLLNTIDIPMENIALHCHNTYGQALANILTAYKMGVSIFDSSIGGLGGCPYSPGSSGNISTEELVYMFNGMNIDTGVSLDKLYIASQFIFNIFNKHANYPFKWLN